MSTIYPHCGSTSDARYCEAHEKDELMADKLVPRPRMVYAFCAISPHGVMIRATIEATADDAWRRLRASVTNSDSLYDRGWRVARLRCQFDGYEEYRGKQL